MASQLGSYKGGALQSNGLTFLPERMSCDKLDYAIGFEDHPCELDWPIRDKTNCGVIVGPSLYIERGGLLWKRQDSASSNICLIITLVVQPSASDEYQLDGRELSRAINSASPFDHATPIPDGIFSDSPPTIFL
jgi:hypothetical protein